ncbi:MAG: hypothetical protein U1E76_26565 [Planctomycetota bacterium]
MTDRRRSNRTMQHRLANAQFDVARRAARERERSLRHGRTAAQRQARAQARLAKEQEREEALASAADEHQENESLLADLRDLLKLAPARIRSPREHEQHRARQPFPPPGREALDRARLERELAERIARVRLPAIARFRALIPWLLAGLALITLGVTALRWSLPAAAASLAGGILLAIFSGWLARSQIASREQALRGAEEAAARATIGAQIAADLERDRQGHDATENERLARLEQLLAGAAEPCAAAFATAAEALELPLGASAAVAMTSHAVAELPINLHAESEIPVQRSTLLKTGRISYRNRPKKDVREDDARAIAALCLLYGAVAFDVLPTLVELRVSAYRSGIDPSTGKEADLCYAAATLDRAAFAELKLDRVDPIAALRSFPSRFQCSATFVLKPVEAYAAEALEREPAPASPARSASAQAAAAGDARGEWLAALEIPAGAALDRATIERARARLADLYAAERFERLAPDLQATAQQKREAIACAARELLRDFPAAPSAPTESSAPGQVRRDNPDLDSIFG